MKALCTRLTASLLALYVPREGGTYQAVLLCSDIVPKLPDETSTEGCWTGITSGRAALGHPNAH